MLLFYFQFSYSKLLFTPVPVEKRHRIVSFGIRDAPPPAARTQAFPGFVIWLSDL